MIKVSVVVPVYNIMALLERCVKSILDQTYKNLELILVDDGSTDDSGALCDQLAAQDSRIFVLHQENQGLSGARNKGIQNATGEYIIFVDADDYWLREDGLEALVKEVDDTTDMVAFKAVDIWKNEHKTYYPDYDLKTISQIQDTQALFTYFVRTQRFLMTAWLVLIRKDIIVKNDIYFPLRLIGEDFYWHMHLWQYLTKVKMVNVELYGYYHRPGSITTAAAPIRPYLDYDVTFSYWKEQCQKGCVNSEAILGHLAHIWVNRGCFYYKVNESDKPTAFAILRKHADLLNHAITPKAKRTAILLKTVGLKYTVDILGLYWRIRNLLVGNAI